MKKIMIVFLVVILSFSMFACKKETEDGNINKDDSITTDIEDKEEEEIKEPDEQEQEKEEDIKEPEEKENPPQEDDQKDVADEYIGLSEKDALALVVEKIDKNVYKIDKTDEMIEAESSTKYYIYTISDSNGPLEQKIAVDNQSGELYCYDVDKTIKAYSKFKLYDESKDAECDWNGTFLRKDKAGKNNGTLELAQGDINSFEFSIKMGTEKGIEFGIGQITGNTAIFEDEKGFKLKFIMKDGIVLIEESGKNTYVKGSNTFAGEYILKK